MFKYLILGLILVLLIITKILNKREKIGKRCTFIISAILVVLLFEFALFNFNAYKLDFSNVQQFIYRKDTLSSAQINSGDGNQVIDLTNINSRVKTVYIELSNMDSEEIVDYDIFYGDESTKLSYLCTKTYNDEVISTKYTSVELSGNVERIYIVVHNNKVKIEQISLNAKVPFEFNWIRCIILIAIILFIYSLRTDEFWKEPFSFKNLKQNIAFILIIDLGILLIYFYNANCYYAKEPVKDLYNYKLVSAFAKKQVHLLEEPSEGLLELENPYDFYERNEKLEKNVDYIWDAAFFNGKYYVYFGPLPALMIMLPYHLITHEFLTTATLTMIFNMLAVVELAILVKEIFKKYFPKAQFKYMFMAICIMIFGTALIWINVAPRFYELVMSAGLFFTLLGFLLIFNASNSENKLYRKLFFGALFLALAVACKPTQLLSSILIIPYIYHIIKNNKTQKRKIVKILLCILIPYVIIGSLLMFYNYIRFGNVFEFGTKYQLTVKDMTNYKTTLLIVPTGILCDLFNLPVFKAVFPFIQSNGNIIDTFSYYYAEDIPAGIFILSPICFCIFGIVNFLRKSKDKELKAFTILLICIAILLVSVITLMAGSTGRYFLDVAWMLNLAGIIIFMSIFESKTSDESKAILCKIIYIIIVWTIIINLLSGFCSVGGISMKNSSPKKYFKIEKSIVFWK